jgi:hypothetical protein
MLDDKLSGCQGTQCAVETLFVVILSPGFDYAFGVIEGQKLMHVQARIAQASVEGFNVSVVRRLSRWREVERHVTVVRPRFQGFRHEFGTVVDGDGLREAGPRPDAFWRRDHVLFGEGKPAL